MSQPNQCTTLGESLVAITDNDLAPLMKELQQRTMMMRHWQAAEGAVPFSEGLAGGVDVSVARAEYKRHKAQGKHDMAGLSRPLTQGRYGPDR